MAKTKDIQHGGIVFGRWKLFPVDTLNWELCQWRETADTATARAAGTVGESKWQRLGRFYSWNTFPNALMYAADCELKDGTAEAAIDIHNALGEYSAITTALLADFARAMEGRKE